MNPVLIRNYAEMYSDSVRADVPWSYTWLVETIYLHQRIVSVFLIIFSIIIKIFMKNRDYSF